MTTDATKMPVFRIPDVKTPVLVLNCLIGALAIMRSLGKHGVPVYGVNPSWNAPLSSRYCKGCFYKDFDEFNQADYLDFLLEVGAKLGKGCILIPTSDELAVFVAENAPKLREYFVFPDYDPAVVSGLASKQGMYALANQHHVPTAVTRFPQQLDEVLAMKDELMFPVMLKAINGDRLVAQTGKKMLIVHSFEELVDNFRKLDDGQEPNLMIQEYIPGGDDQVFIFNGYFDRNSDCLAAYTGHKLRQYPIHIGSASLGICRWNPQVADQTTRLMKDLGYRGILDIGYRLDPRDGKYKVLDINPRVGQAFRLFTADNDMDVVRSLYLDLTGQAQPDYIPREGRRWMIENYDVISTLHYFHEGSLSFGAWLRSFKGVQEAAWFDWHDPLPFVVMVGAFIKRAFLWSLKMLGLKRKPLHAG